MYFGYGATYETAEYELIGYFYVTDVKKQNQKISVQAFDWLRKADKIKWTHYEFPMTVRDIIHIAAGDAGIGHIVGPTDGGTISVDLRDSDGNQPTLNLTCRQAIAAALEISGNYAYVSIASDDYEQLNCGWYPRTADATLTASWLRDYTIKDSRAYTGVQVFGQAISGTSERLFVMSSATFLTDANKADVQARLYDALVGLSVCEANISAVYNPNIRPGQVLSMTFPQAGSTRTITTPITSISIKGGMVATYSSEDINADEADDLREDGKDYATIDYVNSAVAGASNRDIVTIDVVGPDINDSLDGPSYVPHVESVHVTHFPFGTGTMKELVETFDTEEVLLKGQLRFPGQTLQVRTYQSCLADAQRVSSAFGMVSQIKFPVSMIFSIYGPHDNAGGQFEALEHYDWCQGGYIPFKYELIGYYRNEKSIVLSGLRQVTTCYPGQMRYKNNIPYDAGHSIVSIDVEGYDVELEYIDSVNENDVELRKCLGKWVYEFDARYRNRLPV